MTARRLTLSNAERLVVHVATGELDGVPVITAILEAGSEPRP
ncbi:MAG TPA: hypothetical protein VFR49_10565 [Solirubrobacteraceae bacterium]|nr:hypothetical protein [Solirubrobacteraceae bacterium]